MNLKGDFMNKKEIYGLLNEVNTVYKEQKLTDEENIKLERKIKEKIHSNKKFNFRKVGAIAAGIFILGSFVFASNEKIHAYVEEFFTDKKISLSDAGDLSKDIEVNVIELHKPINFNKASFMIENILTDGRFIYLNLIYPQKYENEIYIPSSLKINGVEYCPESTSVKPDKIENNLISAYSEILLDKEIPSNVDLDIILGYDNFDDSSDRNYIEVKVPKEKSQINQRVFLENYYIDKDKKYRILKAKINKVKAIIEIDQPIIKIWGNKKTVDYYVKGKNSKGQTLIFDVNQGKSVDGLYKCIYEFIDKNCKGTPYKSDISLADLYNSKDIFKMNLIRVEGKREKGKIINKKEKIIGKTFDLDLSK